MDEAPAPWLDGKHVVFGHAPLPEKNGLGFEGFRGLGVRVGGLPSRVCGLGGFGFRASHLEITGEGQGLSHYT